MAAEGIYCKTEKGRAEIVTRANKLGLRERALLIMVDDKTTRDGLLAKNTHPSSGDILDALLAQGFVEIAASSLNGDAKISAVTGSIPVVPVATPTAPPSGTSAVEPPQVEVSMSSASKYACRTLLTYLGPGADDLTAMVEKCKTVDELRVRLEKCRDVVQGIAGKKKAEDFWAAVSARLPTV